MLGIFSVVSLVVGVFVAGGGAFDWEFLFSDGYREHDWVRSTGRGGARGLLILFGCVLIVVGFVGQVVDAAAKPVAVAANTEGPLERTQEPPSSGSAAGGSAAGGSGVGASAGGSPSIETGQTGRPAPSKGPGQTASPPASRSAAAADNPPPPPAGKQQPITIWNPEMEIGEAEVTIKLRYRFEPGHQPLAGAEYCWLIEVPAKPTEVVYDSLQNEGRLEYVLRLPQPESGLSQSWSTLLVVESDGKRTQVSNRLDIARGQVRSTPLKTPQ